LGSGSSALNVRTWVKPAALKPDTAVRTSAQAAHAYGYRSFRGSEILQ